MEIVLEPKDWRYSAAILGIYRYLEYSFGEKKAKECLTEDCLKFDEEDITEEKYLLFTEHYFQESMYYQEIERIIDIDLTTEEGKKNIEKINKILNKQEVKEIFLGNVYDGTNKIKIQEILKDKKFEIIKMIYLKTAGLYKNFCTDKNGKKKTILEEKEKVCRILGYSFDATRKKNTNSYGFDEGKFSYKDCKYFDFIPFGFSKSDEAFFINASVDLIRMIRINSPQTLDEDKKKQRNLRKDILLNLKNSTNKLEYDVEIITKERGVGYFKTLYIRQEAIDIFKKLDEFTIAALNHSYNIEKPNSISGKQSLPIEKIVTESILNLLYLDNIIEFLFRTDDKKILKFKEYLVTHLIKVNRMIYKEEEDMTDEYKKVVANALSIRDQLIKEKRENKLKSYEQKLISAISLKDYDRVKEIMIYLSSDVGLPISILVPLCEDFEKNKNLAYAFINCLGEKSKMKKTKEENNE